MEIKGPNKLGSADKAARNKKSGKADGSFKTLLNAGEGEAEAPASVGLSQGITAIDSLLAAQAAEDPAERQARQKAIMRADSLLDRLDDMRMRLLTGTITIAQIVDISNIVATHRERIDDPELTAILDEIDLRAQIELAKLEKAKTQLH